MSISFNDRETKNALSVVSLWYLEVPPQKDSNGYYLETTPLTKIIIKDKINITEKKELDESAMFYNEPSGNECFGSGFLATIPSNNREYVFTASHLTYTREIEKIYCIFGYTLDQCKNGKFFVPFDNLYPVKKIIHKLLKTNNFKKNKNPIINHINEASLEDCSILELDRKVQPPWSPATLSTDNPRINHPLSLYGFPQSTPMKIRYGSYKGRFHYLISCNFMADIAAYTYDSGAPIYDNQTNTVVGILSGGPMRYQKNLENRYIDHTPNRSIPILNYEVCVSVAHILQRIKELNLFPDKQLNPSDDILSTEVDHVIENQDNNLITVFVQLQDEQDHDNENSYFKMNLSRQHNYEKIVEGIQKIFAEDEACNTSSTSTKSFPKKYKIFTIDSNEKLIRLTKKTTLKHEAKVFFRYSPEQPNASAMTINPQHSTHITTTLNNPSNHEVSSITHSQPQQPQIVTFQNFPVQSFPNSNLNLNNNNYNNDNVPESKAVQQNKTFKKDIMGHLSLSSTENIKFTIHLRSETIEHLKDRISEALNRILYRPVEKEEFRVTHHGLVILTDEDLVEIKDKDEVQISLLPSSSIPRCSIS